jgi:hypothetical protein
LVQITIGKIEEERELVILVNIRHPSPEVTREAMVESLKKSADLILIGFCSGKDDDCFTEVERRACCRFIIPKDVLVGIPEQRDPTVNACACDRLTTY